MKNHKKVKPLKIYKVNKNYIRYLRESDSSIFHDTGSRVYIGIIIKINNLDYFAPLSSFKEKHSHMSQSLDLIKIKKYDFINLNNMIPVTKNNYKLFDIKSVKNKNYKNLLQREVREINRIRQKIIKNAITIYNHKNKNQTTPLALRCHNFKKLEVLAKQYKNSRGI